MNGGRRERTIAYGLLAPAVLLVGAFVLYPLWVAIETSLRQGRTRNISRLHELPLGLGNYANALSDEATWAAIATTAIYVVGVIAPAFVIGLVLALLLNRDFPGRRWVRAFALLPWAVPSVVVAISFLWMFDASYGVVNALLRRVGITADIAWFVRDDTALIAVMLPTIWKSFPFFTLTILAALQAIPQALYEAARVDGASPWQGFRFVTWPGIRAAAALAVTLQALWVIKEFDIIYTTTGGGPAQATETLALLVYHEAFEFFRFGPASALGVIMVAICAVLALISMRGSRARFH